MIFRVSRFGFVLSSIQFNLLKEKQVTLSSNESSTRMKKRDRLLILKDFEF